MINSNSFLLAVLFMSGMADLAMHLKFIPPIGLAGYNIHFRDLFSMLFLSGTFFQLLRKRRLSYYLITPILLLAYSLVVFVFSIFTYGKPAGLNYRDDLFFFSLTAFLVLIPFQPTFRLLFSGVAILAGYSLFLYTTRQLGIVPRSEFTLMEFIDGFAAIRNLDATHAYNLFTAALVCWAAAIFTPVKERELAFLCLAMFFLVMVVVSLIRTVWVVTAIGALLVTWHQIRLKEKQWIAGMMMTAGVMALVGVVVYLLDTLYLREGALEVFAYGNSLVWRYEGWVGLIEKMSPLHMIVGSGYGADMWRMVLGRMIEYSAHNAFIGVFFYTGFIGLAAFCLIYFQIWTGLRRVRNTVKSPEDRVLWIVLYAFLFTTLAFYIPMGYWIMNAFVVAFSLRYLAALHAQVPARRRSVARQSVAPWRDATAG